MAERGGQPGNQNAAKSKRWRDAIDRALERRCKSDGIAELDRLADEFLDAVRAEGIAGFKEFGDRMDGKPAQALEHSGPGGEAISLQISKQDYEG